MVKLFLERHLIPDSAMTRFDAAIAAATRLRNSALAEVLLLAFVYGVGILVVWRQFVALTLPRGTRFHRRMGRDSRLRECGLAT